MSRLVAWRYQSLSRGGSMKVREFWEYFDLSRKVRALRIEKSRLETMNILLASIQVRLRRIIAKTIRFKDNDKRP